MPSRFFHGSHDRLKPGDVLRPGGARNHELSSGTDVYVHPDPGVAQVFAEDFHGKRGTVYEVEAPGARAVMEHDPWGSEHLCRHAVVKRVVPSAEVQRLSANIDEHGYL